MASTFDAGLIPETWQRVYLWFQHNHNVPGEFTINVILARDGYEARHWGFPDEVRSGEKYGDGPCRIGDFLSNVRHDKWWHLKQDKHYEEFCRRMGSPFRLPDDYWRPANYDDEPEVIRTAVLDVTNDVRTTLRQLGIEVPEGEDRAATLPMNEEAAFLDGIKANPEDLLLRLVYADWLEDRGDARSEYLRVDGELHELIGSLVPDELFTDLRIRKLRARLKKLGKTLDVAWTAIFDELRPKFSRCSACRKTISAKEAVDTNPRSFRKMKTSRYCKLCFEDAIRSQLPRGFDSSGRRSSSERDYHGRVSGDD